METKDVDNRGEIILYQTEDGLTQIDVKLENETVWLSQQQMADLFQRDRTVVSRHISDIFREGELSRELVCAKNAHTTRHITCPDAVIKWIKSTTYAIQIIDKWRHEIPIKFKTTESLLK